MQVHHKSQIQLHFCRNPIHFFPSVHESCNIYFHPETIPWAHPLSQVHISISDRVSWLTLASGQQAPSSWQHSPPQLPSPATCSITSHNDNKHCVMQLCHLWLSPEQVNHIKYGTNCWWLGIMKSSVDLMSKLFARNCKAIGRSGSGWS